MFRSLNAAFILVLAPGFAWLWVALARRRAEPSGAVEFAIAVATVASAVLMLASVIELSAPLALMPVGFIVAFYFMITLGEG